MPAEFRTNPQGKVDMAILPTTHEADGIGSPHLGTNPHTPAAQNAILIPERIADFLDPAAHRDVLNGPGIGSLGYEQFRDVASQCPDLVAVAPDDHAFLYMQGARGGDF